MCNGAGTMHHEVDEQDIEALFGDLIEFSNASPLKLTLTLVDGELEISGGGELASSRGNIGYEETAATAAGFSGSPAVPP